MIGFEFSIEKSPFNAMSNNHWITSVAYNPLPTKYMKRSDEIQFKQILFNVHSNFYWNSIFKFEFGSQEFLTSHFVGKIIKNDQVHTYISNCLPLKPSVACNQQNP